MPSRRKSVFEIVSCDDADVLLCLRGHCGRKGHGNQKAARMVAATSLKFICRNPSTRNASNPITEAGDGDHPSVKGRKNERLLLETRDDGEKQVGAELSRK